MDEACVELLDTTTDRLIIVADELDLIVLIADLDAALAVDLVTPEVKAVLLSKRIDVEGPGSRSCEADGNGIGVGGEGWRYGDRRNRKDCRKPFHLLLPLRFVASIILTSVQANPSRRDQGTCV